MLMRILLRYITDLGEDLAMQVVRCDYQLKNMYFLARVFCGKY